MTPRLGRPLEPNEAKERARQAAVLGDPLALRVLSTIASGDDPSHLSEELRASGREVEASLAALRSVGMLSLGQTGDALTAEAWVRYGRLLTSWSSASDIDEAAPVEPLPESIVHVARDLAYRFSSTFNEQTVVRYVLESYQLLNARAKTRAHLPALTARYAADRLEALASARGIVLRGTPEVLFVCVRNASRSQIAAAYLSHLAGSSVHVRTAGSSPDEQINPRVIASLREAGIPLPDEYPKPLTDEVVRAADYVITMGCGDACPVYPGRRYMDWSLDDPTHLDEAGIRRVRDDIRSRVEQLIEEMGLKH
ncbi:Protein-tyrosine-phosphatase [Brevibacterium sandarakinum]|uniref:Protein-tyrosine-phosphatase n=1 Tax=Brevibacterium sandarakinum TaxID=629680 RepID=A0A1H1NGJ0_BRESA|nr:Protein-tyrosine-phosphatase [Brevibacterium sandarakinum]